MFWSFMRREVSSPSYKFSILVDGGTQAILARGVYLPAIIVTKESVLDSFYVVHGTLTPSAQALINTVDPADLSRWAWNKKTRSITELLPKLLTPALRDVNILAQAKVNTVAKIMRNLNTMRLSASTGLLMQDTIYFAKRLQAKAYKDSGHSEEALIASPYVMQYAEFADITPEQAADDILFKARMSDDLLAKTEFLRLTYINKVKKAGTVEELGPIYSEFLRSGFRNAHL